MKIKIIALTITALVAVSAPASAVEDERLLVFGDSMTAQYTNDFGDPMQGWYSIVAQERGWDVERSAQGGGGLIKKGFGCSGTAVRERFASTIAQHRPTKIIQAVGYNDRHVCINGRAVPIADSFRRSAAVKAMDLLARTAEANGMSRSDVYVTVPWGTLNVRDRNPVVTAYKAAAEQAGLTFINVRRFNLDETRDKTHPNRKGAEMIARTLASVR